MSEELDELRDIAYTSNPEGVYHLFDFYVPKVKSRPDAFLPLVIFVHGGAWRAEDKADYALLAQRLASLTSYPVAIPNYRLTKPGNGVQHPTHAEDFLSFMNFILDWRGPSGLAPPYDPSKIYITGHSCSPHMITSILLAPTSHHDPTPSLTPSARLVSSVKGLAFSSGLYDLDLLLQSFPAYKDWFIANTFGTHDSYSPWSTADKPLRDGLEHAKWLIIHSRGDTLVDMIQSENMITRLKAQGAPVETNTDLTGEHNEVLQGEEYAKIISSFVLSCEKR